MAAAEGVVFALVGVWEGFEAVEFSVGAEHVTAACQYLVGVSLMTHVPDDAVVGRIEHIVHGNGEFYRSQARPEMTGVLTELVNDKVA